MEQKTAFITGASSGIGAELAREFVKHGFRVALCARRTDRLNGLVEELKKMGGESIALTCDVTNTESLQSAVQKTIETFGKIDVVIANAGYAAWGYFEDLCLDDYKRQFDTNMIGVLDTIYQTLPELKKTKGRLAIMSSVSGHVPLSMTTAYTMSKHAVKALSLGLRQELKKDGVSVTLISPGFIDSEIYFIDIKGNKNDEKLAKVNPSLIMPVEKAAPKMAKAILKRKRERIITAHGWLGVQLYRFFPSLVEKLVHEGNPKKKK